MEGESFGEDIEAVAHETLQKETSPATDPNPCNNGDGGDHDDKSERDSVGDRREEESSSRTDNPGSIREMLNYDVNTSKGELTVKIICLGDSAVGKSK